MEHAARQLGFSPRASAFGIGYAMGMFGVANLLAAIRTDRIDERVVGIFAVIAGMIVVAYGARQPRRLGPPRDWFTRLFAASFVVMFIGVVLLAAGRSFQSGWVRVIGWLSLAPFGVANLLLLVWYLPMLARERRRAGDDK
jgi:hypothetical protein